MAESRSCLHQIDPLTDLLYLEQSGNVQEYFDAFELLRSRVVVSEENALEIFLRGLEPAMEKCVRWFGLRDVKGAYLLARLKESTIPILGVKEGVVVDEIRAETGLESVFEGSENAVAHEVFDEMPVKDGVSNVNMSIEILPESESRFQDMEFQEENVYVDKMPWDSFVQPSSFLEANKEGFHATFVIFLLLYDSSVKDEIRFDDRPYMEKAEKWITILKERDKGRALGTHGLATSQLDAALYGAPGPPSCIYKLNLGDKVL